MIKTKKYYRKPFLHKKKHTWIRVPIKLQTKTTKKHTYRYTQGTWLHCQSVANISPTFSFSLLSVSGGSFPALRWWTVFHNRSDTSLSKYHSFYRWDRHWQECLLAASMELVVVEEKWMFFYHNCSFKNIQPHYIWEDQCILLEMIQYLARNIRSGGGEWWSKAKVKGIGSLSF